MVKTAGLIAAMPQETAALLRRVGRYERFRLAEFRAYRIRLFELDCVLVRSGVGLERARRATEALMAATQPDLLISFGVAGALRPGLQVGDVVFGKGACLLDEAAIPGSYLALAQPSLAARQAVWKALEVKRARFLSGAIFTTRGSQNVSNLPGQMVNPLLEMETTGIAQAACDANVPLMGLRGVSDSVDQPLPFDPAKFYDEQQNLRFGRIVAMMIRQPRVLAQSIRFGRNVKLASENLAVAVIEILKQMEGMQ